MIYLIYLNIHLYHKPQLFLQLQKNHYSDFVKNHEGWDLVDIYADEGISGTSLKHRDAFNHMIKDCKDGKIDIIVTKSVSRFARNIIDSVQTLRHDFIYYGFTCTRRKSYQE